jgi:hypothetical protein
MSVEEIQRVLKVSRSVAERIRNSASEAAKMV